LSRAAAWLAGVAFAFGGFMVFHRGHVPIHYSAAWLPWVLWGFERFRTSGSMFWVVTTGSLMAFHALGSLVQMIVLGGFAWITFLAYYGIAGPGNHCGWRRFVLGGLGACLLGAIGSLPQTLPMLEVSHWSGYGEFNSDFFNSGYLKFRFLVGLAGPWVLGGNFGVTQPLGYWGLTEHGIFYGVLPLILALLAVLYLLSSKRSLGGRGGCAGAPGRAVNPEKTARPEPRPPDVATNAASPLITHDSSFITHSPNRKEAGFWMLLLFESLALMLGKTLPLHYLLSYLPIYHFFHMPTRHVWIMGLALAWLAAFGLDLLRHLDATIRNRLLTRLAWALLALAAVYVVLIQTQPWPVRPDWSYRGFWVPPVCTFLAFVFLILVARTSKGFIVSRPLDPTSAPQSVSPTAVLMMFASIILTFADLALNIHGYELSPTSAEFLTDPQRFPEVVRWLQDREALHLPPRCLIRREAWPMVSNPGQGSTTADADVAVPAGFGSAWGISSLNYYTQSMPRSLLRILQLDFYGNADFGGLLAEERGLSAAAGRYILARGPLPLFAPGMASLIEPAQGWSWKTDDCSPGHPSPLTARGEPGWPGPRVSARRENNNPASTLVASFPCDPGQNYVIEGVLPDSQPRPAAVRVVRTRRNAADTLGEMTITAADRQSDGIHFSCTFESGTLSGAYWITIVSPDGQPLPVPRVNLWHLTSGFAKETQETDAREVMRKIRSGIREPYPMLARFPGHLCVYENPHARSLAQFIQEVRPARDDSDASQRITAPGPPVRDLAYIIAPNGRSADWELPGSVPVASGSAEIHAERPDDLQIKTSSHGEGFLVLAITRCIGWSANIDGHHVPIHGVDGPFMGVRVPPGDHFVQLTYRPILLWAGTAAALLSFGGAWIGVILGGFLRRRRSCRLVQPAEGTRAMAA
jgi:hypothetical protein